MKRVNHAAKQVTSRKRQAKEAILSQASGAALEPLERRVLMSTTLADWAFTSATGTTAPAATSGTVASSSSASSVGMSAGNTALVTLKGTPTGGTFNLLITDSTSSYPINNIPYNVSIATLQSDFAASGAPGASNFVVNAGSGAVGPYSILLNSTAGGDPSAVLSSPSNALTGGTSPGVTVTNQATPPYPASGAIGPDASAVGSDSNASTGYDWKIVGNNGWNTAAGIGTQGAQFEVPTTGEQNIALQFDWAVSSTKANGQLAVEYTLDDRPASPTWVVAPAAGLTIPAADTLTETLSNSSSSSIINGTYFQNIGSSTIQAGLGANFSSVTTGGPSGTGANNDPYFAVRLVNAATGLAVQNGTNPATAIAITKAASTGTVATITAANTFTAGNTVTISGLPSPFTSLNGTFTIASATSSAFTFAVSGSAIASATTTGNAYSVSAPSNTSANWRFDNVAITGTPLPVTPTIETSPSTATAAAGSNATFTAAALTYDPTTTVQWEYSTTGANGTFSTITSDTPADTASTPSYNSTNGYTTDTLTVPATSGKSGYYYEAIFTDSATPSSATSGSAELVVPNGPAITTEPTASTTVNAGTSVTLTASASIAGTTAPTVQWEVSTTGANGTYTAISDPQDVTNTYVTTGPSSTTSTYTFTPLESQTGDYYEAIFSATVSSVVTTATTTSAGITVIGTPLAQWSFTNTVTAPPAAQQPYSPATTLGTGTLIPLGMSNDYNNGTSNDDEDITNSATTSTTDPGFNEDTWRIRGLASGGQNNGWSNASPNYTDNDQASVTGSSSLVQGAEVDVPVSGYDNFEFNFDWYSTTQGVRDMAVQYFDPTKDSWETYNNGLPNDLYVASSNDFYGVTTNVNSTTGTGTPTPITVNLQDTSANLAANPDIADLSGISTLQLRMVTAYDPSLPTIDDGNLLDVNSSGQPLATHGQYASAAVYAVNEQQELNFTSVGGSNPQFELTYDGQTTPAINYTQGDADLTSSVGSATAIAAALNALSSIQAAGGVTVINPTESNINSYDGTIFNSPDNYTVIFKDPTNVAEGAITANAAAVTGGNPSNGLGGGSLQVQASSNGVVQYNNTSGNWRFDNITVTGDSISNSPTVITDPANATYTVGVSTSVSFTASAYSDTQSTNPIYVQWYEEGPGTPGGSSSPTAVGGEVQTTISGGYSTNTLTVSSGITAANNGDTYYAVFTNGGTPATTSSATLTVVPAVVPTVGTLLPVSALLGGTAVFTATETGGSPAPTVTWEAATSANGTFSTANVPTGAVQNPSSSTGTTTSTLTINNATAADSGLYFEAIFTNADAPSGVATNSAELKVLPPETAITQAIFPGTVAAPDNTPALTTNYAGAGNYETDNLASGASIYSVGFTTANTGVAGEAASDDITATAGTAESSFSENLWRVRNASGGWDNSAPNDTEGVEVDVDTTGYSNIYMTVDWYSTTQGIRDLQEEYNTGSGWVLLGTPLVATANDYYGANSSTQTSHLPVIFDLTGVPAANNNPDLELRLVSAYDPTVLNASGQPYEYTSATVSGGVPTQYNGTSGNWRFGNFSIDAIPDWLSPASAYTSTWNPANNTLTVTGAATIDADPGENTAISPTAEPNIVDSTAGSILSITPPTNSPVDIHVNGITLSNGAEMVVSDYGSARTDADHSVLVVGAENASSAPVFSISSTSKLDLTSNDMIIHDGNLTSVQSLAQEGRDAPDGPGNGFDGTWAGNGLSSSAAAAADSAAGIEQNVLAVVRNGDMFFGSFPNWTVGSAVEPLRGDGNDIIVKYTYNGDTNLEGFVGDDAVTTIGAFYSDSQTLAAQGYIDEWCYGDLDGSGYCNDNDVTTVGAFYGYGEAGSGLPQL